MTFRRSPQTSATTWILVSDRGRARIFSKESGADSELELLASMECPDAVAHPRDLTSDRQGSFKGPNGGFEAGDPQTTAHRQASRRFAHEIAGRLDKGRQKGEFGHLVIFAAPAFLGTLRSELSAPLTRMVGHTVAKDLTAHSTEDIAARLAKEQMIIAGQDVSDSDNLCLRIEWRDDVAVITPAGDLGEFSVEHVYPEAARVMREFEEQHPFRHIVIDFCNADYFGSSTLCVFTRFWNLVRQRGGSMVFCNLSDHGREVLKVTRLDTLWPERNSLEEAVTAVREEVCSQP